MSFYILPFILYNVFKENTEHHIDARRIFLCQRERKAFLEEY